MTALVLAVLLATATAARAGLDVDVSFNQTDCATPGRVDRWRLAIETVTDPGPIDPTGAGSFLLTTNIPPTCLPDPLPGAPDIGTFRVTVPGVGHWRAWLLAENAGGISGYSASTDVTLDPPPTTSTSTTTSTSRSTSTSSSTTTSTATTTTTTLRPPDAPTNLRVRPVAAGASLTWLRAYVDRKVTLYVKTGQGSARKVRLWLDEVTL